MSEELKMKSKNVLKDKSFTFIITTRFEESAQYINELISMLVSSIKTSKLKLNK